MAIKEEIKITPGTTWLPLAAVIGIISVLSGTLITVVWFAATQSSKLDYVVAAVKDVPQMREDIALIKQRQEQQEKIASQEKNSVGVDTSGDRSTPVPLTSPPWMSSVPKGWTIGADGKLKPL